MKNKILLIVVFASFGFAIYALFGSLEKAKKELSYYEGTSIAPTEANDNIWKTTPSFQKKTKDKRKDEQQKQQANNSFNFKSTKKHELSDVSLPDLSFNQPSEKYHVIKQKEREITSDMGTSGVLLTMSNRVRTYKNSNTDNSSAENGYYSSVSETTSSTFMGAPSAPSTGGDVIIDPSGDPDPDSQIPVGEGYCILIILSLGYIVYTALKK